MGPIDAAVAAFMAAHPAVKAVLGVLTGALVIGRGRGWWNRGNGPQV